MNTQNQQQPHACQGKDMLPVLRPPCTQHGSSSSQFKGPKEEVEGLLAILFSQPDLAEPTVSSQGPANASLCCALPQRVGCVGQEEWVDTVHKLRGRTVSAGLLCSDSAGF